MPPNKPKHKDPELAAATNYAQHALECLIFRIREQYPFLSQIEATRAAAKTMTALGCNAYNQRWADIVDKAVHNVRREAAASDRR